MQSTENNSDLRPESAKTIDEVVEEAQTVVWKDATYFTANEVLALAAALAAERDRADRAEAQIAELQQPRSLHLYADACVGGYFLREASDSEKRTLHRFVQEIQSPRIFPEATA